MILPRYVTQRYSLIFYSCIYNAIIWKSGIQNVDDLRSQFLSALKLRTATSGETIKVQN